MQVYFGERWDSYAFEDAREIPVPVGKSCYLCDEPIASTDSGTLLAGLSDHGPEVLAAHIECHLRSIVGDIQHLNGKCTCFGGDAHDERPYRESARAVVSFLRQQRPEQP